MAGILNQNQDEIKGLTVSTTIPDNDVAKLMYYLSCVCTTIICDDDDENTRRLTNYTNWEELSIEDQKLLINLCYTFSPDVIEDKVFFHNRELCTQFDNQFYEIHSVHHQQLVAAESIDIADRTYPVAKIMAYKMDWMQKNYLQPLQRLAKQLQIQ